MKRKCPDCKKEKIYKTKVGYENAKKNNSRCKQCANKWDNVFGVDKANELRKRYSIDNTGKSMSAETKQKQSISMKKHWEEYGYPETAIQKLKERKLKPVSDETRKKLSRYTGERSSAIKTILKERNITYDEYLETIPEWKRYYNDVQRITNQQPIHLLENNAKRGRARKGTDAYHLDHIISIKYGFDNNIDPNIIGDISNLRFIPWKENLVKSSKMV